MSTGVEMIPIVALMKLKNSITHICDELKLIKDKRLDDLSNCIELHSKAERYGNL